MKASLKNRLILALLLSVSASADQAKEAPLVRSASNHGRRSVRSERRGQEGSLQPLERMEIRANGGHVLEDEDEDVSKGNSFVDVSGDEDPGTTSTAAPPSTTAAPSTGAASTAAAADANATEVTAANMTGEKQTEDAKPEEVPTGSPAVGIVGLIAMALACGGLNRYYRESMAAATPAGEGDGGDKAETGSQGSDIDEGNLGDFGEDVYGSAAMSIIRDLHQISKPTGSSHSSLRYARITYHIFLLGFCTLVQLIVLRGICTCAMPETVSGIRQTYDAFENHMYDGKIYKTENGFARGLSKEHYDAARFDTLEEGVKDAACKIPFSDPLLLAAVLFLWVAICVGDMRSTYTMFDQLILNTERAENMGDALSKSEGGEDVVTKLTLGVKFFLTTVVFLPRFLITVFLVWVGCRWLTATNDWGDLVLNGVGLEFVLLIKDMIYMGMVSDRAKREVGNMKTLTLGEDTSPTPVAFLGSIQWGMLAMTWVYLYIFSFQRVLPGYRWDVAEVCRPWRVSQYITGA